MVGAAPNLRLTEEIKQLKIRTRQVVMRYLNDVGWMEYSIGISRKSSVLDSF